MGPVKIGGDVVGGEFNELLPNLQTGIISAKGDITSLRIDGSLIGKSAFSSAMITASGTLGPTIIRGNLHGGETFVSGQINIARGVESLTIGGSVIGGGENGAGTINISGPVRKLIIGGDVKGGYDAPGTGLIFATSIAKLTIRGSLVGGIDTDSSDGLFNALSSGRILSDFIGELTIGGNVIGSNSPDTGSIFSENGFGRISIGGSLAGGAGDASGSTKSRGAIRSIHIGGDIQGGTSSADLTDSGTVQGRSIGSLFVGGSIIAGEQTGIDQNIRTGSVHAADSIGTITVRGSLIGTPAEPVLITARGQANPTNTTDVTLKKLTVAGSVMFTDILLGYDLNSRGQNADAQLGTLRVAGDWHASSLLVGVNPGADGWVGTGDELKLAGDLGAGPVRDAGPISRIAKIVIDGQVRGQPGFVSTFGFSAELVQSAKVNGSTVRLTPGPGNDLLGIFGLGRSVSSSISVLTPDGLAVHVFEV